MYTVYAKETSTLESADFAKNKIVQIFSEFTINITKEEAFVAKPSNWYLAASSKSCTILQLRQYMFPKNQYLLFQFFAFFMYFFKGHGEGHHHYLHAGF